MRNFLSLLVVLLTTLTSAWADVVTTTEELQTAVNAGGTVQLGGDIDLTAVIDVASDKTVTLDLNGHVLNAGNLAAPTDEGEKAYILYIPEGSTLNITDSNPEATHTDWNTSHLTSEGNADLSAVKGGVLTGGKGYYGNRNETWAGALCNYGTLTMTRGTITGNTAQHGGAIENTGTLTMTGVTISNNTATEEGGAIYNYMGTCKIEEGTITGNSAPYGGELYNDEGGTCTQKGVTISNNTATENGGVIYNWDTCEIEGGTVTGNSAQYGGVIYNRIGTCTQNGVTISNNTATYGGGIYNDEGTCEIKGCTISNNTATERGGGMYIYDGTVTVEDGTISGNTAKSEGGICNFANLTLKGTNQCAITDNKSTDSEYLCGGVFSFYYDGYTFTLGGKVVIKDNTTTISGKAVASNLCLTGKTAPQQVALDNLAEGSEIGVTTMGPDALEAARFTTGTVTEADAQYFFSDNSDYEVAYNAGGYLETVVATAINNVNVDANVDADNAQGKFIQNGKLVIVKAGKQYNAAGQRMK